MQKKVVISLLISLAILLGFVGWGIVNTKLEKSSFIEEKDPKLTDQERKVAEDRLFLIKKTIQDEPGASNEEKSGYYLDLGTQLHLLGRLKEAQDAFDNARELNESNPSLYVSNADLRVDRGDNEGGLADIKKAVELQPTNPEIWKRYITIEREKLNASNETINSLYIEAQIATNLNIDILTAYAKWLESVQNYQSAKEYWQKAAAANPVSKALYDKEIKRLDDLLKIQNAQ